MKQIQTSTELESTSYRCLFEGIKENGVEPFLGLVQDILTISRRETLIKQTLFSSTNDLAKLKKNHREIIKYFKLHKEELVRFSVTNENILMTLLCLSQDNTLLDLYLENARKLEELKVSTINFQHFQNMYADTCRIYRNKKGQIIHITKYYTDGQIVSDGQEILIDSLFNNSIIPFSINLENKMTFVLRAENNENSYQFRNITIENFGFDSAKLPSEEELQSYEIPQEYVRKRIK